MEDQPLVACGHCGSRNRRTSEDCFICGRAPTGLEVEVAVVAEAPAVPPTVTPDPPRPASPEPVQPEAAETMALGAGADEGTRPWNTKRRRTAIIAAAVAGTLSLGTGVWTALDGDSVSDPFVLRAAVTEEPDLAWTRDADREMDYVTPMDRGALVVLGAGEVVALDEDGAVRWRQEVSSMGYAIHDPPTEAVHVSRYGQVDMSSKVTSLDAATGEEQWTVPGEMVTTVGDAMFVSGQGELRRIDPDVGSDIWSLSIDGYAAITEDAVHAFADGDLHSWDLDGDEEWVSDADVTESPGGSGGSVVALDDFIVATGPGSEVVGIDPGTGNELWRADPGYVGGGLGGIQPHLAYAFPPWEQATQSSSSEATADGASDVTVYDRDGEVATLASTGGFFSPVAVAVEIDGDPHVVELSSGTIYDEDFKGVGTVPARRRVSVRRRGRDAVALSLRARSVTDR